MLTTIPRGLGAAARQRAAYAAAAEQPKLMKAAADAYGEGPTTLVTVEKFKFIVDEPPKLGGKGLGPNPLSYFLGSLAGCTGYTATMIAKEKKLPEFGRVLWKATGQYDLRGVRGVDKVDARFQKIVLEGTVDTELSQEDLDALVPQVERRCIVASTCRASGMEMALALKKGTVEHDCQPACELHDLEKAAGTTGVISGDPGRDADTPRFAGTGGKGKPAARGYHTSAVHYADGEDVAREHLHAEEAPQLQKKVSDQGAPETAGGAYGSRDSPKAQASQPTEGMSDADIVAEQTAGTTTSPLDEDNNNNAKPPGFADAAAQSTQGQKSPLGVQPSGQE